MEFVKKNIKWIALGACALVALSVFLPYASVTASAYGISASKSINFIEGDGVIQLVLVIIAAALLFVKSKIAKIASMFLIVGGMFVSIYDAINVGSTLSGVSFGIVEASVSLGIGFYLGIIGSIIAIAAIVYDTFFLSKVAVAGMALVAPSMPTEPVVPVQEPFVQPMPTEPVAPVQNSFVQPVPTEPVAPVQNSFVQPVPTEPVAPVQNSFVQPVPAEPVAPVQNSFVQPVPAEPVAPVQNSFVQPMPTEPVAPVQESFVQPMPTEPVAQPVPVVVCPICGSASNFGTEVCGTCGNKLN